jgi:hypothetical protein
MQVIRYVNKNAIAVTGFPFGGIQTTLAVETGYTAIP